MVMCFELMPQMYMTTSQLIAFQFNLIQDGENFNEYSVRSGNVNKVLTEKEVMFFQCIASVDICAYGYACFV